MSGKSKQSPGMKRMWEIALTKKTLVVSSCVLSVLSVIVAFAPFIAIYFIIRELAIHMSDLSAVDSAYLIQLGWMAGGSAVAAIFLNFFSLMCSHVAAFKTLYHLKLQFTTHLASLPMGLESTICSWHVR